MNPDDLELLALALAEVLRLEGRAEGVPADRPCTHMPSSPCATCGRRLRTLGDQPAFRAFDTRLRYLLWRNGYHSAEALRAATDERLMRLRNFGPTSLARVRAALAAMEAA